MTTGYSNASATVEHLSEQELEEQITCLEQRLLHTEDADDSAYEKRLAHTYRDLIRATQDKLTRLISSKQREK